MAYFWITQQDQHKLAVQTFKCLQGDSVIFPGWRIPPVLEPRGSRSRSASSSTLIVRRTRLSTVSDRALLDPVLHVRNELPRYIMSAPSQRVFCICSGLKTHIFSSFFPDFFRSACEVTCVIMGHFDYWQLAEVPVRLLHTGFGSRRPLTTTLSQSTTPRNRLNTFGRWAFSVTGPTSRNSLPDSLRDPIL